MLAGRRDGSIVIVNGGRDYKATQYTNRVSRLGRVFDTAIWYYHNSYSGSTIHPSSSLGFQSI